jgi:hypothetical protein
MEVEAGEAGWKQGLVACSGNSWTMLNCMRALVRRVLVHSCTVGQAYLCWSIWLVQAGSTTSQPEEACSWEICKYLKGRFFSFSFALRKPIMQEQFCRRPAVHEWIDQRPRACLIIDIIVYYCYITCFIVNWTPTRKHAKMLCDECAAILQHSGLPWCCMS